MAAEVAQASACVTGETACPTWNILRSGYALNVTLATQIELDSRGIAWIGGTKVKVLEVVLDKTAYGWSPDEIHLQHPHLSLAQIHAALAYYYENQAEIDAQIEHWLEEGDELARIVSNPEFRRKIGLDHTR